MAIDEDRIAVLKERDRRRVLRGGIGLYSYQQSHNTTPFQFAAQIVVGTIVVLAGIALLYGIHERRVQEVSTFGSAESHWGGVAFGCCMLLVGVFFVHAGVNFYWRKFRTHR